MVHADHTYVAYVMYRFQSSATSVARTSPGPRISGSAWREIDAGVHTRFYEVALMNIFDLSEETGLLLCFCAR